MFKNPFSFKGRIRRFEYALSILFRVVYLFISILLLALLNDFGLPKGLYNVIPFLLPFLWFSFAQAAKRCHDLGKSGWFQLIPFYPIWLVLGKGQMGDNEYGSNPKLAVYRFESSNHFNQPA